MTREERAAAIDELPEILEIEFVKMAQRVEELVGRPVFDFEMTPKGREYFKHEILSGKVPTFDGVFAKFPADVPVVGLDVDAET